jgi:hypothetical protein
VPDFDGSLRFNVGRGVRFCRLNVLPKIAAIGASVIDSSPLWGGVGRKGNSHCGLVFRKIVNIITV